ncbi:MAG TPA: SRPBCC family protein [Anaerolineales bacterium]
MDKNLIASASVTIDAPQSKVWEALVDPQAIEQYMFGTSVVTDWKEGSPIIWKGEWQGRAYEDKGTILEVEDENVLQYSHFSPLSGQADVPENYHTVTIELSGAGSKTMVTLTQDNNESEEARQHSEQNWEMMLEALKKFVEE